MVPRRGNTKFHLHIERRGIFLAAACGPQVGRGYSVILEGQEEWDKIPQLGKFGLGLDQHSSTKIIFLPGR